MTDGGSSIKVGDRVRVAPKPGSDTKPEAIGRLGTVAHIVPGSEGFPARACLSLDGDTPDIAYWYILLDDLEPA